MWEGKEGDDDDDEDTNTALGLVVGRASKTSSILTMGVTGFEFSLQPEFGWCLILFISILLRAIGYWKPLLSSYVLVLVCVCSFGPVAPVYRDALCCFICIGVSFGVFCYSLFLF